MSSSAFFAEVRPDSRLRRIVLWSGGLLGVAGVLIILNLPTGGWAQLALAIGWSVLSVRELRQLRQGWADCRCLRFTPDGKIAVLCADARWRSAHWEAGGVLLRKVGWIRLRNHRGALVAEPLRGDSRASADWRRLHVIWRHIGA